jgi:signal transduction histidine kinase
MRIAADRAPQVIEAVLADMAALGLGVVVGSGQGGIIDANETFCELVGYDLAALRALPHFGAFIAPDERAGIAARRTDRAAAVGDRAGRAEAAQVYSSVLVGPQGKRVPVDAAVVTVEVGDGKLDIWVVQDLRIERSQAEVVERLESLVDRMPIGATIWGAAGVTDPADLRLLAANRAASDAVAVDLRARIGWRIVEVFPDAVSRDTAAQILALRGTGRSLDLGERHFDPGDRSADVYRRRAVDLSDGNVALLFENVTEARADAIRRRTLLERLVESGDEERRQLAMGVHDDPVQQLAAAKVVVESLLRRRVRPAESGDEVGTDSDERLADVETALRAAMVSLRRLVFDLSPPELTESGLESAIRSAAAYLFTESSAEVSIDVDLRREPSPTVQTGAYRIVAEALTNACRHADARRVSVVVHDDGRGVRVEVTDDGRGFDTRSRPGHIGLRNMRERAAALGGACQITSDTGGTTVRASLPYDEHLELGDDVPLLADIAPLPSGPTAGEVEALRRERDSLIVTASESLRRAMLAEGRVRDALAFAQIILRPGLTKAEIVDYAASMVGELLGDASTIRLLSADGTVLEPAASWHADPDTLVELNRSLFVARPATDWHTGTALDSGQPVVIDLDVNTWLASDGPDPGRKPFNIRWGIVAPLRIADDVFGTLTVMRERTGIAYDDRDVDFVQSLADGVSLALRIATRSG